MERAWIRHAKDPSAQGDRPHPSADEARAGVDKMFVLCRHDREEKPECCMSFLSYIVEFFLCCFVKVWGCASCSGYGGGIAHWQWVGLTVLLDAASWVQSSSGENFSGRGDFSLGVDMDSDSVPPQLFRMRV